MKHRGPGPEEIIQRAVIEHYKRRGNHDFLLFHVPNGGGRSKAEGGVLKAMGTRPGVSDLLVSGPDRMFGALELKAPGKKPSVVQRLFGHDMERCGHKWAWADNLDDALSILEEWGALRPDVNQRKTS